MILGYLCSKKECHSGNAPRQYVKGLVIEGGNDQMNPYQVPSSRAKCVNNTVTQGSQENGNVKLKDPCPYLKFIFKKNTRFIKQKQIQS